MESTNQSLLIEPVVLTAESLDRAARPLALQAPSTYIVDATPDDKQNPSSLSSANQAGPDDKDDSGR